MFLRNTFCVIYTDNLHQKYFRMIFIMNDIYVDIIIDGIIID